LLFLFALAAAQTATPAASVPHANLQAPTWSPDGRKVSVEANFHEEKRIELHVGPPGSLELVRMPTRGSTSLEGFDTRGGAAGRVMHELVWAPQGGGVFVYGASTAASDYDLYVSEGSPLAPAPGADGGPAWSSDGRWLAFTSARTGQGDLYLLDVQALEKPPRRLSKDDTHAELFPTWAPDSEQIVYVGHADEGDALWLISLRNGVPQQLTSWPGEQLRPSFSPNGALVAFYANREQGDRFDLYVLEPRVGAEPRKLVEGVVPNVHGPTWTPDGQHLVVVVDDDDAFDPIVAVSVTGEGRHVLDLGTVGHGDLDLGLHDGVPTLAFVAQGLASDATRDFKRLFVAALPTLP